MLKTKNIAETTSFAPLEIWEVLLDNATVKFHQPLILTPTLMPDDPEEPDDEEYLQIICPELNIDVWAENQEDLLEIVHSEIRFVWKHIVLQDDGKLDAKSKTIKRNHLALAEVVDG
jgi:hypothetical protein